MRKQVEISVQDTDQPAPVINQMLDDFSEISNEEAICQDRSSNDIVPGM